MDTKARHVGHTSNLYSKTIGKIRASMRTMRQLLGVAIVPMLVETFPETHISDVPVNERGQQITGAVVLSLLMLIASAWLDPARRVRRG